MRIKGCFRLSLVAGLHVFLVLSCVKRSSFSSHGGMYSDSAGLRIDSCTFRDSEVFSVQIDTAQYIGFVDSIVGSIDSFRRNGFLSWREVGLYGLSTEGTDVSGYHFGEELLMMHIIHFGELGRSEEIFYIYDGNICFVILRIYDYDRPIYEGGPTEVNLVMEEKIYLHRDRIIRWVRDGRDRILNDWERIEKEKKIRSYACKYMDSLRDITRENDK